MENDKAAAAKLPLPQTQTLPLSQAYPPHPGGTFAWGVALSFVARFFFIDFSWRDFNLIVVSIFELCLPPPTPLSAHTRTQFPLLFV